MSVMGYIDVRHYCGVKVRAVVRDEGRSMLSFGNQRGPQWNDLEI